MEVTANTLQMLTISLIVNIRRFTLISDKERGIYPVGPCTKKKIEIGRFPRAQVAATSVLGYCLLPLLGAMAE